MSRCGKCGGSVDVVTVSRGGRVGEAVGPFLWLGCILFWLAVAGFVFPSLVGLQHRQSSKEVYATECAKVGASTDSIDGLRQVGVAARWQLRRMAAIGLGAWLVSAWLGREKSKTYHCSRCGAGIELVSRFRRPASTPEKESPTGPS